MRPKRIILARHGESVGNVSRAIYDTVPDYALTLTEKGHKQAKQLGSDLNDIIQGGDVMFYVSSYTRTKQTYQGIISTLKTGRIITREDPRLREQEWRGNLGSFDPSLEVERDNFGYFFYRFIGGESCADVYDRISNFFDTLFRDFTKPDFPENVVVVTHGMSMRVFLMRWFNMPVEKFELIRNSPNCGTAILELDETTNKYNLTKDLVMYPEPTHPYHFPI